MKAKMQTIAEKLSSRIRIILNHMNLMDRTRQQFEPVSTFLWCVSNIYLYVMYVQVHICISVRRNYPNWSWHQHYTLSCFWTSFTKVPNCWIIYQKLHLSKTSIYFHPSYILRVNGLMPRRGWGGGSIQKWLSMLEHWIFKAALSCGFSDEICPQFHTI